MSIKLISKTPEVDKLMALSQKALAQLTHSQTILAMFADDLGVKFAHDPYVRTALHGIMPPKEYPGE
jgi:hypothetical protein